MHHSPEHERAIQVMTEMPVYFPGGRIQFERAGAIELYRGEELVAETVIEQEDAALVALQLWRDLSTMPEQMLLSMLQAENPEAPDASQRALEGLVRKENL